MGQLMNVEKVSITKFQGLLQLKIFAWAQKPIVIDVGEL
jgi:hypothetical protein